MLLTVVNCLLATSAAGYYITNNSDAVLILVPVRMWLFIVLPASVLGFVLSGAAMVKADGYNDTNKATLRLLITSIVAAIVPPILYYILVVLRLSTI
jgi:predicted secreted protein